VGSIGRSIRKHNGVTFDFIPVDLEAGCAEAIVRLAGGLRVELATENFTGIHLAEEGRAGRIVGWRERGLQLPGLVLVTMAIPNDDVPSTLEDAPFNVQA